MIGGPCCACALAGAKNAAQVTKNIATAQHCADPRNSLINQDAESRAAYKLARDTRQLEEKQAIVKAGFSSKVARPLSETAPAALQCTKYVSSFRLRRS